jgi:Uma2 family endonuclease
MTSACDLPNLDEIEDQTAFNLAVWEKLLADEFLATLPHRIETNRFGQIIMMPPPGPDHGEEQFQIGFLIHQALPHGRVITECPISTSDGVKAADVAWISGERKQRQRKRKVFFDLAPEICVEIFSPDNTRREMQAKRALYFEAGAEEVWFCHLDGRMEFFCKDAPTEAVASRLCPQFPRRIEIE